MYHLYTFFALSPIQFSAKFTCFFFLAHLYALEEDHVATELPCDRVAVQEALGDGLR